MMKAVFSAVILALSLAVADPVGAQMISPMLYNGPQISLQDHANRFPSRAPAASAASKAPVPAAVLTYHPDPTRRRDNLTQFVAKVRRIDPQGAVNLEQEFSKGDFIGKLQAALQPYGLHVDNVADAYASYWINAYLASRGDASTPSRIVIDAVKAQAARALEATPELAQAGDAAKQTMAEALLVQAALLDSAIGGSKGDPAQMRVVSKAAIQGAAGMGLDLMHMELTEQGFIPKAG